MTPLLLLVGLLIPSSHLTAETLTCAAGDTACVIDAVLQANEAEDTTLLLAAGIYTLTQPDPDGFREGDSGLPRLTGVLTIQGQGPALTVLERAPTAPLFRLVTVMETGVLTLRQLTLAGGAVNMNLAERGGGLLNFGTVLCEQAVLRNHAAWAGGAVDNVGVFQGQGCAVQDNFAGAVAGGLGILGPTTLERSLISGNISEADAGLSWDPSAGQVDILHSVVSNNLATRTGGGGGGGNGDARFVQTVFAGNLAGLAGGALVYRGDGTLIVRQGQFLHNSAVLRAGGLLVQGGLVRLLETNVVGNVAGLGLPGEGGGIVNQDGTVRVRGGAVYQNRATTSPDCVGELETRQGALLGDPSGCTVLAR